MPVADHDHDHDHEPDPFEERFADALRNTGTAFGADGTDRQDLAARGEAHGRRMRSRRRVAVAGTAAAVALVGLGGALLLPGGQGGGGRQQTAAASPPSPSLSPSAPTAPQAPMSADDIVRTLEKLLPEGGISSEGGHVTDHGSYAGAVYDDGRGKAAITVSLDRVQPGSREARQITQCPDKLFVAYDACTTTKLSDGSVLMLLKGYEYPNSRSGTKRWTAELVTPAGGHVGVQEWNAAAEKGSPVTRKQPPLDLGQLTALVTAHEWRTAADAMPLDKRSPAGPDTTPATPRGSISATLTALVPDGLKIVSKSPPDDDQFGYLVLDDGRGRSLVQVNVQPGMQDVEDQLFGSDAKVLPDGTKVALRKQSGDKGISGIVWWSVDTIRPDGLRVVISAFNSGAQNTPATREEPVLTMEQMEAIATDRTWLTLG
ncbi:hypothetical protein ACFYNZ_08320 [Streptomyces kebangsaanensis]|uniref:Serine/threonine protein kinase n=1 Tax=Streptomyces kebangsaanensis TaxID=864058 RepID=A0ABW6KP12_9ACTN